METGGRFLRNHYARTVPLSPPPNEQNECASVDESIAVGKMMQQKQEEKGSRDFSL